MVTAKKPTAKDTGFRLAKRRFEQTLAKYSENYFRPTTGVIILTAICVMLAVFVLNWATGVKPPAVQQKIEVSLTRLNENEVEVMIIYMESGTTIRHLTYATTRGRGVINSSASPFEPLRDAGEYGIVPVSGYDEYVEITAAINDTKTIKIFSGKI
ncbi:MAG: hypothetical protein PHU34_06610 [Candidatus Methanoperedens sp.]|nr:hypothetical protein [Candidatus Methanoperedens sp.]